MQPSLLQRKQWELVVDGQPVKINKNVLLEIKKKLGVIFKGIRL